MQKSAVLQEPVATTKKYKIGIPRGMFYYEHGVLWENFFKQLGFDTVISPVTNKAILDLGVKNCSSETCLPVKVFHGHVLYLADKADYIFVPRYISFVENESTCPKFCGLPDMVELNLRRTVKIIQVEIDKNNKKDTTKQSLRNMADVLSIDFKTLSGAYYLTVDKNLAFMPDSTIHSINQEDKNKPAIAVIGHPYMTDDSYLSMEIHKKLKDRGYRVLTSKDADMASKYKNSYPFSGRRFWSTGYDALGGAVTLLEEPNLKGIIYISPFACGLDAIVAEFLERRIKERGQLNYMKLTVDEHTGEAGFDTRVEAFLDMIES